MVLRQKASSFWDPISASGFTSLTKQYSSGINLEKKNILEGNEINQKHTWKRSDTRRSVRLGRSDTRLKSKIYCDSESPATIDLSFADPRQKQRKSGFLEKTAKEIGIEFR